MSARRTPERVFRRVLFLLVVALAAMGCELLQPEPTLTEVAQQLNARGPVMVDSETRLEGITVEQPSYLSYHYTLVNIEASRVDTHRFRLALWPGLLSTIKLSPEMEKLRKDKVTIRYYYNDKNNRRILLLVFRPEDYAN